MRLAISGCAASIGEDFGVLTISINSCMIDGGGNFWGVQASDCRILKNDVNLQRKGCEIMIAENELDSTCGISDEELTKRFVEAIRHDNEKRKIFGLPVSGFNQETQKAYLEFPDGTKKYIDG